MNSTLISPFKPAVKPDKLHRHLSPVLRFEMQTQKNGSGCWEWTGHKDRDGYGRMRLNGNVIGAHRFSYLRYRGPIPEGMLIRHLCHNPGCVSPYHLAVGTSADNAQDAVDAGRHYTGELNPRAKLTADEVREIRAAAAAGKVNKCELARRYGVTNALIGFIIRGRIWKHLEEDDDVSARS